jgi:hypothetical protein
MFVAIVIPFTLEQQSQILFLFSGLAFRIDMIAYIHLTTEQAFLISTVVVPIKMKLQ